MVCWPRALACLAGPRADELDFTPQARALAGVVACAPGVVAPARFDAKVLSAHCRQLAMLQRWWQHRWLSRAQPFLEKVVPADLPSRVVYPFGGGDLLTALVTFPHATEINTLSLEPSGDVRAVDTIDAGGSRRRAGRRARHDPAPVRRRALEDQHHEQDGQGQVPRRAGAGADRAHDERSRAGLGALLPRRPRRRASLPVAGARHR